MGVRTAVAMSGGVDSSTAALLLLQGGHDLIGLTMVLFSGETPGCSPACALRARRSHPRGGRVRADGRARRTGEKA